MKEVTGVVMKEIPFYYIATGDTEVEVPKEIYSQIMESLADGDYWVFDDAKHIFIKYGTQLNLFEEKGDGCNEIK